jgi:hypothetical protein
MVKKSPFDYTPEEMASHVDSVKGSVDLFLRKSIGIRPFSELVEFMKDKFRMADEQMFKEWVQKEFPGQFRFVHVQEGKLNPDDIRTGNSDS